MEFWGINNYYSNAPTFVISYDNPEDINATYDGSFQISGEYNDEDKEVSLSWDQYKDDIDYYDIFKRTGNDFKLVKRVEKNTDDSTSYSTQVKLSEENTFADLRVMAVNNNDTEDYRTDDTNYLSNIVSFKKTEETTTNEEETTQPETTTISEEETTKEAEATPTYEQTTIDTDGDVLEDGYEIWDLKTLWNTETEDSTSDNKKYDMDTDNDGFPDSYEVFTLGTDPAVANRYDSEGVAIDSDNDGWSDYKEYTEGTDPWLKDSDFDGDRDKGDSTPRKTNSNTKQAVANAAQVHKGKYDREYTETEEGVTETYIKNIYREDVKSTEIDYGNIHLNKTLKYFYDEKGNNTAIIEAHDDDTDVICITYTYDSKSNVVFICDQSTRYTMSYDENNSITSMYVGNKKLINYGTTNIENHAGEDGEISSLNNGDLITKNEKLTTYGNNQKMKTITSTYKVSEDDKTGKAESVETYYENTLSYKGEYNSEGNLINFIDYTVDSENPIVYNYNNTDNNTTVTRSDGFTKTISNTDNTDNNTSTSTTSYKFKDIKDTEQTYISKVVSPLSIEEETTSETDTTQSIKTVLYNNDICENSNDTDSKITTKTINSKLYNKDILKTTQTVKSNINTTYNVDIYAEDKDYDYTYDLAGNITQIKLNNEKIYEYSYDAHGRLTDEKDYTAKKEHEYTYNTTGNIIADTTYNMDNDGNQTTSKTKHLTYNVNTDDGKDGQWPDQLVTYDGEQITYDQSGNPLTYINGLNFTWSRGRQLTSITNEQEEQITYKYNQDGLRTYKETKDTKTSYEYDNGNLIRETVTYKSANKKYDVWYIFDSESNVIGYEYSYINDMGSIQKVRIYYEKNMQGDVVGLLDSRGAEIATYSYDAWGNITDSLCYEGNETAYNLNHITYRSYYRDNETGFYYLQSRYYDAEVGRFINADDVFELNINNVFKHNKYIYCCGNPVNNIDPNGKSSKKKYKVVILCDGDEFSTQASGEKTNFMYGYEGRKKVSKSDISIVKIYSAKQFKSAWENVCSLADYVTIIMHSGPTGIGVRNDAIANNNYDRVTARRDKHVKDIRSIEALKKIKLKQLRLYTCDAGFKGKSGKETYYYNIARTFLNRNKIEKIYCCDGNVAFSGVILKHTTTYPDYYVYGVKARLSHSQGGFNKLVKHKRKPQGFYWMKK